MFAFAKKLVSSIEQQAQLGASNDLYFKGLQVGLRVLSVQANSLLARFGFESWFDFVVKINDYEIGIFVNDQGVLDHTRLLQFVNSLTANRQNLTFQVWSAKGGHQRLISVPFVDVELEQDLLQEVSLSQHQNQTHIVTNANPPFANLGLALQLVPLQSLTYTWHVLETHPNSPAYKAGLLPQADYIIGAQDGLLLFGGEHLLTRVVSSRYERSPHDCSVVLYVYNHDFDVVRPVTIQPTLNWGGPGLLGCNVGYGLLHRIPEVVGKFGLAEDDFLDDDDFYAEDFDLGPGKALFSSGNVFVPGEVVKAASASEETSKSSTDTSKDVKASTDKDASDASNDVNSYSHTASAPFALVLPRKKRLGHANADLLSYFDEETKRSHDLDRDVGVKKPGSVPPPPPKPQS